MHLPNSIHINEVTGQTAGDYEVAATDRLGEFRDRSTENYGKDFALKEAHVFAMLAVGARVENLRLAILEHD